MSAAQNVMASEPQQVQWHYVCETNDLVTNSGVCALVDSQQVAIFSLKINGETQVFAISNYDPIGKACFRHGLRCEGRGRKGFCRCLSKLPLFERPHEKSLLAKCIQKL